MPVTLLWWLSVNYASFVASALNAPDLYSLSVEVGEVIEFARKHQNTCV